MDSLRKHIADLVGWVREHPKLAIWAGLSFLFVGTVENIFFDGVKAVLYALFGNVLVVSDVIALAWFISKIVIPTALAGLLVYAAFHVGRAGMPRAPGIPRGTVPLLEAATRACEATEGTMVDAFARARIGTEDRRKGTLTYYCYLITNRLTVYGNHPPSRVPRKIDWERDGNRYSFRMRDGALILLEHNGDDYYENLHVLGSELPAALEDIKAVSPDPLPDSRNAVAPSNAAGELHALETRLKTWISETREARDVAARSGALVLEQMKPSTLTAMAIGVQRRAFIYAINELRRVNGQAWINRPIKLPVMVEPGKDELEAGEVRFTAEEFQPWIAKVNDAAARLIIALEEKLATTTKELAFTPAALEWPDKKDKA